MPRIDLSSSVVTFWSRLTRVWEILQREVMTFLGRLANVDRSGKQLFVSGNLLHSQTQCALSRNVVNTFLKSSESLQEIITILSLDELISFLKM